MIRGRAFPTASTARERACGVLVATGPRPVSLVRTVPLVEGKRRELDRWDVCPGGPTGQGPARGSDRARELVVAGVRQSTAVDRATCGQRLWITTPVVHTPPSRPGRR